MAASSMMAEGEIGSWEPFTSQKGGWIGLVVGGVFLLLIGLGIASIGSFLIAYGGFFILIGVILIIVAVLRMRKPKINYVLTNRRAMVTTIKDKQQSTLQACDLAAAQVTVLNRRHVTVTKSRSGGFGAGGLVGAGIGLAGGSAGRSVGQTDQVGDVIFMIGGLPQVRFVGVGDPDGVKQTADQIILNLKGAHA